MNKTSEIEEISDHIKQILNERKNIETKLIEWEEVSENDLFEVTTNTDDSQETTKLVKGVNLNSRICDLCKKTINLEENLSGLVIHDSHFLCESCCQESSKEKLDDWTASKMAKPGDLKPVALWLMKEKNKNKLF